MTKNLNLTECRQTIDKIDREIYQLLSQRADVAVRVGELKQSIATETDADNYYRPDREAQVLRNLVENNRSVIPDAALTQIFRDIMSTCLALQKPLTVAFLGPVGTFSHLAVEKHFGKTINFLPAETITRIFREVEAGNAHLGVVPIENSTEGVINTTLDALVASSLQVCSEIQLPIHHCLLRHPADTAQEIRRVYAHPQALAQCRQWLDNHLPLAERIPVNSNGEAAKNLNEKKEPGSAAIASEVAAELYQLTIHTRHIEDNPQNTTRFLVIGKLNPGPTGKDKTSLLISSPHTPGTLFNLLQPFAKREINLTLIESRPYHQRNWSYLFFIDIEGHQQDEKVQQALAELSNASIMLTILGSYPRAVY